MPTNSTRTRVDDQRKDHIDTKVLKLRNRPKQLQTHNLPTNDVENINRTNKGRNLLLANKPRIVPWRTERMLQRIQRHGRITLHRSTLSKWEQNQTEKSGYGAFWTVTKVLLKGLEDLELADGWRPSKRQHYWERTEYLEESWRLEETCCHSDSSEKPSANADEKSSNEWIIIIIIIIIINISKWLHCSIWHIEWTLTGNTTLGRVNLRVTQCNGTNIIPISPELESRHEIQFNIIELYLGSQFWGNGVLPLGRQVGTFSETVMFAKMESVIQILDETAFHFGLMFLEKTWIHLFSQLRLNSRTEKDLYAW